MLPTGISIPQRPTLPTPAKAVASHRPAKVRITNGRFTYDDREADLFAEINGFFLNLDGSLTDGKNKLDIETGSTSILFSSPTYTLENKLTLKLKSQLLLSDNFNTITLE